MGGALAGEDLERLDEDGGEWEVGSMAELADLYRRTDRKWEGDFSVWRAGGAARGGGVEGMQMEDGIKVAEPLSEFVVSALNYHVSRCEDDAARSAIR